MRPTFTIGIEEEYQTVDPVTRDLRSHIHAEMIEKGKLRLQERVKAEMHQSVVEVGTRICANVEEARAEVLRLRGGLAGLLEPEGLRIASAGTHPFSLFERQRITARDRYRNLVDNASDSIMTFSLDGNITSVNRAYAKLTGWTTDELLGENWQTLVAPVDRERMAERTRRSLAGEKLPSIFEVATLCKDGRVVQLEGRTRTVRTLHGTPVGFQGVYRDISERKRAEEALRESEERYRLMFQEAEDARAVLDRLYRVTSSMQMSWEREDRLRAFEQGVHEALGFDRFYVALVSPDLRTLDVATAVGVAGGASGAGRTRSMSPVRAHSAVLSKPIASISSAAWLVLGSSNTKFSITRTCPSIAFWLSAERSASRRICLGMRCE